MNPNPLWLECSIEGKSNAKNANAKEHFLIYPRLFLSVDGDELFVVLFAINKNGGYVVPRTSKSLSDCMYVIPQNTRANIKLKNLLLNQQHFSPSSLVL